MRHLLVFLVLLISFVCKGQWDYQPIEEAFWAAYWNGDFLESYRVIDEHRRNNELDPTAAMLWGLAHHLTVDDTGSGMWEYEFYPVTNPMVWSARQYLRLNRALDRGDLLQAEVHARAFLDEPERITRHPFWSFLCFNAVSRVLYEAGKPRESLQALEYYREAWSIEPGGEVDGRVAEKQAILLWSMGELQTAEALMEQALSTHARLHPEVDVHRAQLTNNLGVIAYTRGDLDASLRLYELARDMYIQADGPNSVRLHLSYANIGRIYRDLGHTAQALEAFQKRAVLLDELNIFPFQQVETAQLIAEILHESGRHQAALQALDAVADLMGLHFPGDNLRRLDAELLRTRVALTTGDLRTSRDHLDRAQLHARALGLVHSGKYASTIHALEALMVSQGDSPGTVQAHVALAKGAWNENETQSPPSASGPWPMRKDALPVLLDCTRALAAMPSVEKSTTEWHFEECERVLNALRLESTDQASQAALYRLARGLYPLWINWMSRYRASNATAMAEVLERSKAFTLKLGNQRRKLFASDAVSDSLFGEYEALRAKQEALLNRLDVASLLERDRLQKRQSEVQRTLLKTFPEAFTPSLRLQTFTVDSMQQLLDDRTAVASFILNDSTGWCSWVTCDTVELIPLNARWLIPALQRFRHATANRDSVFDLDRGAFHAEVIRSESPELLRALFPKHHRRLPKKLIVSPAAAMAQINLGICLTEPSSTSDWAELPYLFKETDLIYTWHAVDPRPVTTALAPVGIFGYAGTGNRAIAGVQEEMQAVAEQWSDAAVFLGDRCTPAAFAASGGDFELLHLASHAQARGDVFNGGFFFSNGSGGEVLLSLSELVQMELSAHHATLSACETGDADWQSGEPLGSLAAGFEQAGCPSLTVSLWKSSDQTSAVLMEGFYRSMRKGENKCAAFRNAVASLLDDPSMSGVHHPYFWGGFAQVGRPLQPESSPSWWWLLALVLIWPVVQQIRRFRRPSSTA